MHAMIDAHAAEQALLLRSTRELAAAQEDPRRQHDFHPFQHESGAILSALPPERRAQALDTTITLIHRYFLPDPRIADAPDFARSYALLYALAELL